MMGNHQVRFLGEGAAAMPLPYPTPTKPIELWSFSVKPSRRDLIMEHRELLEEFFLEAFPNPERVGCPDEDALEALAENGPVANDPVLRHVASCSECYREYRHLRWDDVEQKAELPSSLLRLN
jgi:hypothetical protein